MIITKRTKGQVGFNTPNGRVNFFEGRNELTEEQYLAIKDNHVFIAMIAQSEFVIAPEIKLPVEEETEKEAEAEEAARLAAEEVEPNFASMSKNELIDYANKNHILVDQKISTKKLIKLLSA